jgi:hypothetical protein
MKVSSALVTIPMAPVRLASAYVIGTIASFWFIERLSGF